MTGHRIQSIRLEGVGEHEEKFVLQLKPKEDKILEMSPPYEPQGNERTERFMQDLPVLSKVMLTSNGILDILWAEDMYHGN